MDIPTWLNEILQPDSPKLDNRPETTTSLNRSTRLDQRVLRHQRIRNQSDSSVLTLVPRTTTPPLDVRRSKRRRSPATSACSDTSYEEQSKWEHSSKSSDRYARRSRRKTRPERYEPSSKTIQKQARHTHQSHSKRLKKSRRKTKNRQSKTRSSALVQDFQAKNVLDGRLTIKPQDQLGIFNKGKTSAAFTRRGLPDLVFSEMKFLQRHENEPGHITPRTNRSTKQNKGQARMNNEKVSVYFTLKRKALNEGDGVSATTNSHNSNDQLAPRLPFKEMSRPSIRSVVEGQDCAHKSTSHVSWSESNRGLSRDVAATRAYHDVCLDTPVQEDERTKVRSERPGQLPNPSISSWRCPEQARTTSICFGVSPIAASLGRLSRSHSCPRQSSSPQREKHIENRTQTQLITSTKSPCYIPPHAFANTSPVAEHVSLTMPNNSIAPLANLDGDTKGSSIPMWSSGNGGERKAHIELCSIPNLRDFIQRCNDSVRETCMAPSISQSTIQCNVAQPEDMTVSRSLASLHPVTRNTPREHFDNIVRSVPAALSFAGPGIYEQQIRHDQDPRQIDDGRYHERLFNEYSYANDDDEANTGVSCMNEAFKDYQCEWLGNDSKLHGAKRNNVEVTMQRPATAHNVIAPGFWKPNRLY